MDEIEAEIQESDEINSRVMDLLRLINEATTPKDDNEGISTVPTTNVSETTSSGSNANETAPSGYNNRLHLLDQVELQLWLLKMVRFNLLTHLQLRTLELCNHRIVLLHLKVVSKTKTEARSTQISKTKHPKLENEAPKSRKRSTYRKRSTQNSKPL